MPPRDDNTVSQFLLKFDALQRDVNQQNIRLERLATIQENQISTLDTLSATLAEVTRKIPELSAVVNQHQRLKDQVIEHDRQISEQTGRWIALDSRKRPTPYHGVPRPSFPPKMPAMKDLKDWGNILRLVIWGAVISAGITAAMATGNKMGWIGSEPPRTSLRQVDKLPASEVELLLKELRAFQASMNYTHPPTDASLTDPSENSNE